MRRMVEQFDIMKVAQIDQDVSRLSQFLWVPAADGYSLYLKSPDDKSKKISISQNLLGKYEVTLAGKVVLPIGAYDNLEAAFREGDQYLTSNHSNELVLYSQTARWRKDLATDKQKGFLRALKVDFPNDLTKGAAAMLINNALANKKAVKV
jgi:hypothetical protein